MKPSTYTGISHEKLTSNNASDTKTANVPKGTSAIMVTVETNPARITFEGTDPATGTGMVVQNGQNPWFLPLGPATQFRAVSTTVGPSVIQLAYCQ